MQDTDGNGVLDCDEKVQQSFTQEIECEDKPQVTDVSVSFNGTGNINSTTTVTSIYNIDMLSTNLAGLVGAPVKIETESSFDEAVITFKVDKKIMDIVYKNKKEKMSNKELVHEYFSIISSLCFWYDSTRWHLTANTYPRQTYNSILMFEYGEIRNES